MCSFQFSLSSMITSRNFVDLTEEISVFLMIVKVSIKFGRVALGWENSIFNSQ